MSIAHRWVLAAGLAMAGIPAQALGPHEILLLVNARSPDSVTVANHYARLRGVPPENIVRLDLPDRVRAAEAECTAAEYTEWIWTPATQAIKTRGLDDRVLAWVYSADFPVRVRGNPAMSVQGLTFVRNAAPASGLIISGLYASALFRGPTPVTPRARPSFTLDNLPPAVRPQMPLPAIALAHTGARGLATEAAVRALEAGVRSDGVRPAGAVYLVTNNDVRTRSRAWQFEPVVRELAKLGVKAGIVPDLPAGARDVAGVLAGSAGLDPSRIGSFAPGAMAEHLTSFAAVFHTPDQTKLTAWLRAGASSSAGTVVEPFAIWTKFPSAWFFVPYASGCTLLESYAQSVVCPLQLHIVGDPLLCPWGPRGKVRLVERTDPAAPSRRILAAQAQDGFKPAFHAFFLDGRLVTGGAAAELSLDTANLSDGYHAARVVAYGEGDIRVQAFDERALIVDGKGRSVEAVAPADGAAVDALRPFHVRLRTRGGPAAVALFSLGRKLVDAPGGPEVELSLSPEGLGEGPVSIQPAAVYADGSIVLGRPGTVVMSARNRAPAVSLACGDREADGRRSVRVTARDEDGDPVRTDWFEGMPLPEGDPPPGWRTSGGTAVGATNVLTVRAGVSNAYAVGYAAAATGAWEYATEVEFSGVRRGIAALAYDIRDGANFLFFGWWAERSAWCAGACERSNLTARMSRGIPEPPTGWVRIAVRQREDGTLEGMVADETVCRLGRPVADLGVVGFAGGRDGARFRSAARAARPEVLDGAARLPAGPDAPAWWIRASDGFSAAWREVR